MYEAWSEVPATDAPVFVPELTLSLSLTVHWCDFPDKYEKHFRELRHKLPTAELHRHLNCSW